ncbi:hypothetical protein PRMUPPPA20_11330 [Xylanibacter ruminicola]|jgi:hypothetical protein|uniref:Uncharacterized protein n=2 Tax=Xylanibacter ruminicola TaxID=839 RepID=D5EYD9_XYLR2|nr:hypothetical protein PRU_0619 [Xylanibacter ruminicola 23]GJG33024.1 hypothetical protein PRMUPPPA20_11330 [Xylanibacter ruminicola]
MTQRPEGSPSGFFVPNNVKALLNCPKVLIFATRIINLDEDETEIRRIGVPDADCRIGSYKFQ